MLTRPIPSTGEPLPIVGCGTYRGFDTTPGSDRYVELHDVLAALFAAGGTVIDSSPMYGRAETTTGELLAQRSTALPFIATKVWTSGRDAGIAQMQRSMERLRTERIDLMQVHNLLDWQVHLKTLRDWKAAQRVRYIGVTHYTASAFADLEKVMRAETLDFVQLNYSIADRAAEARLLPLAQDRGIAVLVNRPFGSGGLLRAVQNRPLPAWSAELACKSWPELLLKYVAGHPAVTCAIPGTGRSAHMAANALAGGAPLPDARGRARILESWHAG